MVEIHTDQDSCNYDFHHEGDNHRQDLIFEKGDFVRGLPKKSRQTEPSHSDLSRKRWRGAILDKREERQLVRDAKSGDERAKQRLVESFHRFVLSIADQYFGPPHNDLMAAGLLGFCEAISRFNENRDYRLSTYSESWIRKYIRLEVKRWRREGAAGETRADRYAFSNPGASAEEVVAAVGGSTIDAEGAISRLGAGHDGYNTTEQAFDEDGNYTGPELAASVLDRFKWSPQLRLHEIVCGGDPGHKRGWIDDLVNHSEAEARRRFDRVGRRQYALDLIERERIVASFRNKESRYLYRADTDLKERVHVAARINTPIFPEVLTFDRPKTFEVSLAVQMEDKRRSTIIKNMQRLRALRLALVSRPKSKRKQPWPDTPVATQRENSFHSRYPLPLPVPPVKSAKNNFGQSRIYAGLHYSAI